MALYIRFMVALAVGLCGLAIVLKTVIDTLFTDWDAVADLRRWWRATKAKNLRASGRAEDLLLEIEKAKTAAPTVRMLDDRREQLRQLASVERRLHADVPAGASK